MNKLDELIRKLCPNGVEYYTIGEIANYRRGSFPQPYTYSSFYGGEGAMPFVQVADIEDNGFKLKNTTKQTISKIAQPKSIFVSKGTVICSIQGTIGRVAITQYDAFVDRTIAIFKGYKIDIDKKFFAYCLQLKFGIEKRFARGSTLKTITKEEFTKFKIPVPPIEVQSEVVRILDNFTELGAELELELEVRKKQYEYYRNILLDFEDTEKICDILHMHIHSIKTYKLEDLADFKNGIGHEKEIVDNGKFVVANSKFISTNGEVKKFSNSQKVPLYIDDILMVMSDLPNGRALAKCFLVKENHKYTLNQRIGCFHVKDSKIVSAEFLYYILNRNKQLLRYDNGVDQTNLRKNDILNIKISIPPIEAQKKIVSILDRFDELCNNVTQGLPAEIEARRKQYKYYRDKLLSFKEIEVRNKE